VPKRVEGREPANTPDRVDIVGPQTNRLVWRRNGVLTEHDGRGDLVLAHIAGNVSEGWHSVLEGFDELYERARVSELRFSIVYDAGLFKWEQRTSRASSYMTEGYVPPAIITSRLQRGIVSSRRIALRLRRTVAETEYMAK
jgi:hypothetical protein